MLRWARTLMLKCIPSPVKLQLQWCVIPHGVLQSLALTGGLSSSTLRTVTSWDALVHRQWSSVRNLANGHTPTIGRWILGCARK